MGNCLQVVKFRYSEEAFSEYLIFMMMMIDDASLDKFYACVLSAKLHTWNQNQENNFIDLLWKVTTHCTLLVLNDFCPV